MTIIAPKSSITANAVRNTFNELGTFLPTKDKIPKAKAISVAMGIPIPDCVFVPKLNKRKIKAGKIIPPKAPEIGKIASFILDNSPI